MQEMPTTSTQKVTRKTTAEEIVKIFNIDLTGKVVIVTGSNSGIGFETARVLASTGAKVIIPCRTLEKSNSTIKEIQKTVPNADLVPMQLDLSDIASIKTFAKSFLELGLPLHILINNAGCMSSSKTYTKDGFEMTFGVNHLGHFLLVELLKDKIKASAPSRIVIVSSAGQAQLLPKTGIEWDNLQGEKYYSGIFSYAQSKLANIYHGKELQRRFNEENADVTVTCLHPGFVAFTSMGRSFQLKGVWDMFKRFRMGKMKWDDYKSLPVGAATNVYCAVAPDIKKGEYYVDCAPNTFLLNEQANNQEAAKKLWDISEQLLADK